MRKRGLRDTRHKQRGKAGFISSASHRATCIWLRAIIRPIMTSSVQHKVFDEDRGDLVQLQLSYRGCSVTCRLTRMIAITTV